MPAAGEGGNTLAIFGGHRDDGERFVYYELVVGTWGGRPAATATTGSEPVQRRRNIPVEVAESEFPILIERYGLVPDSGGARPHRGGVAVERSWRLLAGCDRCTSAPTASAHRPYGLDGGSPGAPSSNRLRACRRPRASCRPMFSTTLPRRRG